MSESHGDFGGNLLSSLAQNPELLKNAMQMASMLASSGILDGFLGKSTPSEESPARQSDPPPPAHTSPGGGERGGEFADLLASLAGNTSGSSSETSRKAETDQSRGHSEQAFAKDGSSGALRSEKKHTPPCHNDRIQLLKSVRPFLPEDKREKIDFFIQLLGLLYSAEQMGLRKLF